jgi:transposase-like protein
VHPRFGRAGRAGTSRRYERGALRGAPRQTIACTGTARGVDGVAERLHPGLAREAVLCAWGIDQEGKKVLLALSPGTKEDTESCRAFFQDMRRRGLGDPLLAVTDGAPGLIRAVEERFPRSHRQRCLADRMRNLEAKVPEQLWPEVRARAKAAYEAPSSEMAAALRDDFVAQHAREGCRRQSSASGRTSPRARRTCASPSPTAT